MKCKGFFAALLMSVLLMGAMLFPSVTYAEPAPAQPRLLTVTGQGRLEVKPDTATIILGVTQLKPTAAEAYNAMSADLVNITGAVKAMGLKEEQIQTNMFNLQAEYTWTQEKGQVMNGYRATNTLSITTQELEKVASLIQSAMNAGANQLQGVHFSVKDTDKLAQQAMDMAVDDAKAKAGRVAARLGAKVVRVQTVSVQDNGMPFLSRPMADSGSGMAVEAKVAAAPVFGGSTTFSVSVYVTFEIE